MSSISPGQRSEWWDGGLAAALWQPTGTRLPRVRTSSWCTTRLLGVYGSVAAPAFARAAPTLTGAAPSTSTPSNRTRSNRTRSNRKRKAADSDNEEHKRQRIDKPPPNSGVKIRLYPNREQRRQLRHMFDGTRAAWNTMVRLHRDGWPLKDTRDVAHKKTMALFMHERYYDVPHKALDSSYWDLRNAWNSAWARWKKNGGKPPTVHFRSWRVRSQSIELDRHLLTPTPDGIKLFPRYFTGAIKVKETLPALNYTCRLQMLRGGRFFLCVPTHKVFPQQPTSVRACAIDPGVRAFVTVYDPTGLVLSIADEQNKIFRRCLEHDRQQSKISKSKNKRERYRARKRSVHIRRRIRAMVDAVHHEVSAALARNYTHVLLPKFETVQMTARHARLSSTISRKMLTWAHYRFRMMLQYKLERVGGTLVTCTEEYTTKTCSRCGVINYVMRGEHVFSCPTCNHTADRDVNAAVNIYIKNSQS